MSPIEISCRFFSLIIPYGNKLLCQSLAHSPNELCFLNSKIFNIFYKRYSLPNIVIAFISPTAITNSSLSIFIFFPFISLFLYTFLCALILSVDSFWWDFSSTLSLNFAFNIIVIMEAREFYFRSSFKARIRKFQLEKTLFTMITFCASDDAAAQSLL